MTYSRFNKKWFVIGLALVVTANFLAVATVFAQTPYVPLAPLPGTTVTEGNQEVVRNAGDYIKGAFNLAIGVAAALAIIMIVIGGVQYMATESIGGKSAGLKRIKDAVLGLLLALGSYVILLTINPALVNFSVSIAPITTPTALPPAGAPLTMAELGTNIRRAENGPNGIRRAADEAFNAGNSAEGRRLLGIAEEMRDEDLTIASFDQRMANVQIRLNDGNLVGAQAALTNLNDSITTEWQRLTSLASEIDNIDEKNRLNALAEQIGTIQTNFTNSTTRQIDAGSYYFSFYQRQANGNDTLQSAGPFLSLEQCQTERAAKSGTVVRANPQPGDTTNMGGGCGRRLQ